MVKKNKFVLIDGNAILHRAYFALPPLTTRRGQPVNAVYGFSTMLLKVINDLKPTHLAVTFDTEKPTFRHAEYVGYQAQRPRMESELSEQIEIVQEVIQSAGIPFFVAPGYEADDVIGTIAKKAAKNMEVFIVTGDRDMFQLVGNRVKVYAPVKGLSEVHIFDTKEVKRELGVNPSQIVEYKGLVGDPSDNYPGVSGIGPKTAVSLLSRFKTIEGIYKNLKKLDARLVGKLASGHESAMLSQRLARIVTDVPVEFDFEKMKLVPTIGNKKLIEKFEELGFKSLVARLTGKEKKKKKSGNGQMKLI